MLAFILLLLLAAGCRHRGYANSFNLTNDDRKAIEAYLVEKIIEPVFGGRIFCAYRVLLSDRQTGKICLWALIQEFYRELGDLREGTGISVPLVLDVREHNGKLLVTGHTLPADGGNFPADIERLFPQQIKKQICDYPAKEIQELAAEIRAKARLTEQHGP
jgi:hypothetical protein